LRSIAFSSELDTGSREENASKSGSCACEKKLFQTGTNPSVTLYVSEPEPETSMEAAIDRIMQTYDLLLNRTTAASEEARAKVTEYVTTLFEAGEKDPHRLTVCGLTYLRQLDGSSDPVKAGYTGL